MTHKKTIIFLILCALIVSAVCVSGCVSAAEPSESTFKNQAPITLTTYYAWSSFAEILVYVDPQTGVNYVILREPGRAGICPRYNADGTLYISEVAA